jgi:serine protease AprX
MTATHGVRARSVVASLAVALIAAVTLRIPVAPTATVAPAQPGAIVDASLTGMTEGTVSIIVQKWRAAGEAPERRVAQLGGTVTRDLPIVGGFAADLPATSLEALARTAGIRVISEDRKVQVFGAPPGPQPRSVYPKVVRANQMLTAGYNGGGITVALVDTGVAAVPDLAGRIVQVWDDIKLQSSPCVNMSGEDGCGDSYGHGTFLAGIIAGSGASSPGGKWKGVAPGARIVSLKIAGRDGSSDVSRVLAAIQWVVSFKDRYGIKILNLSLGTDGTQSYRTDPLNYAVERAWGAGIVVVVSASNRGPDPATISKPGDDPWVITVGATDDKGTVTLSDDTLPGFSSHGPTAADGLPKPDIAAPGGHIVSLRAPGSEIDTRFPNYIDGSYRAGSGTSMSAAVVSGAVALMLDAAPSMSPNRVKFALAATARAAATDDAMAVGSGVIDVYNAALHAPGGTANQGLARSSGTGTLDGSRGSVRVAADDPMGTVVQGMLTLQLLTWDPLSYVTGEWSASSWYASSWYASSWYASSWYASSWYASSWYASSWYGEPDASSWYGNEWYASSWYGAWE